MYYRVTVTKDGKHLFSTDAESAATVAQAVILYHELSFRFPRADGYTVQLFEITKQVLIVDPLVAKHRRVV